MLHFSTFFSNANSDVESGSEQQPLDNWESIADADTDARTCSPPEAAAAATNGDVNMEDMNDIPDAPAEWQDPLEVHDEERGLTLTEVASLARERSIEGSSVEGGSSNRVNLSRGSRDLSDLGTYSTYRKY